jgi:hypothetical protein
VLRVPFALLIALPVLAQVQADVTALATRPSLAAWQKSHPGEFDPARYSYDASNRYEVDFLRLNRWCGAAIGQAGERTPEGMTRAALFYVPSPAPEVLPSLPARQTPALTDNCELDAIWYETLNLSARDNIVRTLSASWGNPNGASEQPNIQGSGLWKDIVGWHRLDMDIWVAYDPNAMASGGKPRLVVYAARNTPSDWDLDRLFGSMLESQTLVAGAVAQIAALGPALTSPILSRSRCSAGPSLADRPPAEPLARWLTAAKGLAPARRVAALLLADFYITCAGTSPDPALLQKRLVELGAKYQVFSPGDGPDYTHNFREQAERLDPRGPAGELAGLVSLYYPCFLKGAKPWPDLLIEKGTKMLTASAETAWTPYIHFALARAYASKLSLAYPGGDAEGGRVFTLSPAMMQQERSLAISHLRYFLKRKPGAPESVFAWQEAWRLLAGLLPSQVHFGCTGE